MNKSQIWAAIAAFSLFLILYLGFDTKTNKIKTKEIKEASVELNTLVEKAAAELTGNHATQYNELDRKLKAAQNEPEKVEILKDISAFWFQEGQLPVAGVIAEQVAQIEKTDSSWSVAGGTFFTALVESREEQMRDFCAQHAVLAFEKAASLAPERVEHRVNLALVWAENPDPNNPMQAVMMLRELETKHPDNPSVYNALGRLAIKTGQWQRAVDRLEKSWSLNKNNPNTPCLLARAYEGLGNKEKATEFLAFCKGR
jgi:tetratricopeptide (TPR) repeat protein